jgi:tetratricopeptide (TPR) repeat protein
MLWTYKVFRRAYPEIDTHDAAETAGFQSLKMGQHEGAIALLERNARDYPNVATSAFGLGRAYATAGHPRDARTEFERALQLDPKYERASKALKELNLK